MTDFQYELIGNPNDINIDNDNIDIYVTLENGKKYFATLFTIKNIEEIMKRHEQSGESANGIYFWSANMCIVKSLDDDTINRSIQNMISDGVFHEIFAPV
jgi:hypothetical protein